MPPETRITTDVGRDICAREGIGPLVVWTAAESGQRFTLEARILNPQNLNVLAEVSAGPFERDAIIDSIGALGKKLLRSFDDSSLQIFILTKPLSKAVTKSTDALRQYDEAVGKLHEREYPNAKAALLKALELDPEFALAMVELASLYDLENDTRTAIGYLKRAFERRESLTEPDKIRVTESYYWFVENNHAKAIEELEGFLKKFPRNQERLGTLATDNFMLMKFAVAAETNKKLLGEPPWRESSIEDAVALWKTQLSANDFDRALETAEHIPDRGTTPYLVFVTKLALGENPALENEIFNLTETEKNQARLWLTGFLDLCQGKLQTTLEQWKQYILSIKPGEGWMTKSKANLWLARLAWLSGKPEEAHRYLEQVNVINVRDEVLAEVGKYYARLGDLERAQELLETLRSHLVGRSTNQNDMLLKLLQGEIELEKGNSKESFSLMSQAPDYPWAHSYWSTQESRAYIALATHHADVAIKICNEMLGKRGFAFASDRPDDWVIAHYYLARSYDESDAALALSSYRDFEHLWSDGDPTINPLSYARKRIAELAQ